MTNQIRWCLALDLRNDPDLIRQYRYVHTPEGIWPEIPKGIREVGISDMEIYLWKTRMFMILEAPGGWDFASNMDRLGKLNRQPEWADYVWQFQQSLPWAPEGEKWIRMERVFALNTSPSGGDLLAGYPEPLRDHKTLRFCATLDLREDPELMRQYRHYHSPEAHWKEIASGIREVGILDMQIYLTGNRMFMVVETGPDFDWDRQMKLLGSLERQQEWEQLMQQFQQALPGVPSVRWERMDKVFDLDLDF